MDLAGIISNSADPRGKPWRVVGTAMVPNTLLMGKLVFLLLLSQNFLGKIRDPLVPFIPFLDVFRAWPGLFENVLLALFLGAGVLLLMNITVRPASVVLGLVVMLDLLASKPLFRNHLFICGCLFLLAGLHRKDERPWMIYLQMSVIYLGAFLNKMLEPDWHTGQFMHNWLLNARANPFYEAVYPLLPDLWLAKLLGWTAIASEVAMAVCFLVPRTRALGVWIGLIFHGGLFVMLLGENFGHFLEDILLAYLAFLAWPRSGMQARASAAVREWLVPLLRVLDWDRQIELEAGTGSPRVWLTASFDGRTLENIAALRSLLRYSAGFYVILCVWYVVALRLITPPFGFVAVVLTGAALLLLFLPIPWGSIRRWKPSVC